MDWRELLSNIISNPVERERMASEMGIHPITIVRWASGETKPRSQNLRQLIRTIPKQYQAQFRLLLDISTGIPASDFEENEALTQIPYKLIMEVLEMCANTPDLLRTWSIARLVLPEALKQLDNERQGMIITIVRCMPPSRDGKIRSLRESIGQGNGPWNGNLEEKALLLGAESLAGYVTSLCRLEQVGDLRLNRTFLPAYQGEHEISAVAAPIMRASHVAGCLLFSSTQPNYFASEERLALVNAYTHLIALALDPLDFYDPSLIDLYIMPPLETQQIHIGSFRQRVLKLMQESSHGEHRLPSAQAEQLVWQQFEELLLNLPRQTP